eukprot:3446835-Heterocapsa_arctica.AAC.1
MLCLIFQIPADPGIATQPPDLSPFGAGHLPGEHPIHQLSAEGDAPTRTEPPEANPSGGNARRPRPGTTGSELPEPASAGGQPNGSGVLPISIRQPC